MPIPAHEWRVMPEIWDAAMPVEAVTAMLSPPL
jgi:hypothetical protein